MIKSKMCAIQGKIMCRLIVCILTAFLSFQTLADTYYVETNGQDSKETALGFHVARILGIATNESFETTTLDMTAAFLGTFATGSNRCIICHVTPVSFSSGDN